MGEVEEQVMAEPEEGDNLEVDGLHPNTLEQQNPWFISFPLYIGTSLVQLFGWYLLGFALLGYVIWVKMKPKINLWMKRREEDQESAAYHKDPDRFLAKERAVDLARQRMQERYNQTTALWAEKQKEAEAKQHETKPKPTLSAGTSTKVTEEKKNGKPKLKPEYNPMTGDIGGGACGWRPSKRGASGGG